MTPHQRTDYLDLAQQVFRYAAFQSNSRETAERVTLDTFAKLINSPDKNNAAHRVEAFAIARQLLGNYAFIDNSVDSSYGDDKGGDDLQLTRSHLASLDPHTREVLILKEWGGLSFEEIESVVGGGEAGVGS